MLHFPPFFYYQSKKLIIILLFLLFFINFAVGNKNKYNNKLNFSK